MTVGHKCQVKNARLCSPNSRELWMGLSRGARLSSLFSGRITLRLLHSKKSYWLSWKSTEWSTDTPWENRRTKLIGGLISRIILRNGSKGDSPVRCYCHWMLQWLCCLACPFTCKWGARESSSSTPSVSLSAHVRGSGTTSEFLLSVALDMVGIPNGTTPGEAHHKYMELLWCTGVVSKGP